MEIFYWSDYACPYCYIGETTLKAALRELGVDCTPEMRAFELSPDAPRSCPGPTSDLVAKKYGLSPEQAEASMQRVNEMAADAGLYFDFGKTRFTGTFDAHRLTKLARSRGPATADALEDLGFVLIGSIANFLFARHPRVDGGALHTKLMEAGICVKHFDVPALAQYERITIGTRAQMEELVSALKKILGEDD